MNWRPEEQQAITHSRDWKGQGAEIQRVGAWGERGRRSKCLRSKAMPGLPFPTTMGSLWKMLELGCDRADALGKSLCDHSGRAFGSRQNRFRTVV